MRIPIVSLAVVAAAACTGTPPVQEVDDTPPHPTVVIESHVSSNGLKGLFPFEMDQRHFVRANMGRDEGAFKGTGRFSGFLVNALGPNNDATIARLDRDLVWSLDLRKKQYVECPLKGCRAAKAAPAQGPQKQEHPEMNREPGCVMHVAKKSFSVKPTGRKREVNGFDASEYRVAWIVTLRDKAGRRSTSSLEVEVWTTPVSPQIREALKIEHDYVVALAKAAYGGTHASKGAGDLSRPVPAEIGTAMLNYLGGNLAASDRNALLAAGKELGRIKGLPVRSKVDWTFEGNACAAEDSGSQPSGGGSANPLSGLVGAFGSKGGDSKTDEPLFSFTYDLKALKVEPVRDGVFEVPKTFRRVNPG